MTRHLLSISLGPVQEFIAAARKTADLYAGSQLLQEVVGAAAGTLDDHERIFPAQPGGGGANKILAVVSGDPAERARRAEDAARARLFALWSQHTGVPSGLFDEQRARWQLERFLEVYAAWVPLGADYNQARTRVEALLAGRKALRDFIPLNQADDGVPKSPLDPAYAAVVKLDGLQVAAPLQERFGFKPSEVLDAVSLLKRQYGQTLKGVLNTHTLAHRAKHPGAPNSDEEDFTPDAAYYAVLVADGDNMGKLLDGKSQEEHREISGRLDRFTAQARELVKRHDGQAVFAGGDDVLAFLPATTALACGRELAGAFRSTVKGGTLSAGIAIVHYREPLSMSLHQAREAEKAAKAVDGKNAVCVALHTRGGAPLRVAGAWEKMRELERWQEQPFPRGLPYELSELAREWPEGFSPQTLTNEARRIARRKADAEGRRLDEDDLKGWQFGNVAELRFCADLLIAARFLSGQGDKA